MNKIILLALFFCSLMSCSGAHCDQLPHSFPNHDIALQAIRNADFSYHESLHTPKSSWIERAEFYSCDQVKGYFILSTKKKTYTHKDMPIELWLEFKKATSFGQFYNSKIKGKYQLTL